MKIGLKISDNDLNIKVRKIKSFLEDGDRVKIMIIFRGREMAHKELGQVILDKVLSLISEDVEVVQEGKSQFAVLQLISRNTEEVISYFHGSLIVPQKFQSLEIKGLKPKQISKL